MERNDYLNVGIIIKTRGLKGTFKIIEGFLKSQNDNY